MRSRLLKTFLICTLIAIGTQAAWAADGGNRDRLLNVMTRNVDLGSDFLFIVDAIVNQPGNQTALLVAATMTFDEIVNSKMPARADALAAEIDAVRPDVVAL